MNVLRGDMSMVGPRPLPTARLQPPRGVAPQALPRAAGHHGPVAGVGPRGARLRRAGAPRLPVPRAVERLPRSLDPAEDAARRVAGARARSSRPTTEIWRASCHDERAAGACESGRARPCAARARDAAARAGRARAGCSTSGAATGRWRHGWRHRERRSPGSIPRRPRSSGRARPTPSMELGPADRGRPAAVRRTPASTSSPACTCWSTWPTRRRCCRRRGGCSSPGGLLVVTVPFHGRFQGRADRADLVRAPLRPARARVALLHRPLAARAAARRSRFEHVETDAHGGAPLMRRTLIALGRRAGIAAPV